MTHTFDTLDRGMHVLYKPLNIIVTISRLTNTHIFFYRNNKPFTYCSYEEFNRSPSWELLKEDKPLNYETCKPQVCSHRNIREDRFFSAMVYKTCKDCGKPLN